MTAVRLGEHTPLATLKRWKSVPSAGQAIYVRGLDVRMVVAAKVAPSPVIGKDEKDVWFCFGKSDREVASARVRNEKNEWFHEKEKKAVRCC